MNQTEYTQWAKFHNACFPDFGQWWVTLKPEGQGTLRREWQSILERISLDDAKAASRRMLTGEVDLCPSWERSMLATRISKAARDIAAERMPRKYADEPVAHGESFPAGQLFRQIMARVDAGEDPRTASADVIRSIPVDKDGQRFSCVKCFDSGFVTVWHSISVMSALKAKLDNPRNRKTMVVACCCRAADAICLDDNKTAPKDWRGWRQSARYAPERYCRLQHGDVNNPDRIAELIEWAGDYAGIKSRPNYSPELAAFNGD
jgi:hypothetical protein